MEISKPGSLSVHLVSFCRYLRSKGFMIGPQEELEMFSILAQSSMENAELFQIMLSQLLCRTRQQQLDFPALFDQFWQELFVSFNAKIKPLNQESPKKRQLQAPTLAELKNWLYQNTATHTEETAFYSKGAGVAGDLANYHSDNIKELIRIINQIAKNWASRPSRRKIKSKSRGQLDLRQVMRRNLSTGEMIDISFRDNKIQKPRLVLVCDVSKSMEVFSNFTVQLLYAFQNSYRSIETFVFSTELHHISRLLKQLSFKQAMVQLGEQVPDWSGGTRIGHCLDKLIQDYGSRLLHGKVIFLIVSDGWDTGDTEILVSSMKYIKRRVKNLIWLNPQAGKPDFKPEVQGMLAALPYIDYLHGVHNVDSLKNLKDLRTKI